MDIDRPHRSNSSCSSSTTTTTTSELFICFTSRLSSSSSMKISSKSILSPGRSREASQISLSTSLSRRLRTNGSMRGGQASPMFPTHSKKRGSFDNPEPSSPKVTCIGQVRVKTKKQGKKIRSRSVKGGGEVSFRRVERAKSCNLEDLETQFLNQNNHQHQQQQQEDECLTHRNQKWVHFPVTICEALRGFGSEFNCFLPCRSSCTARSEKDKEEKSNASSSSCGAVFGRWLVAVQDGSDGKGREIELVVGEHEEEEEQEEHEERRRSYRRHVFEEIDFKEDKYHQHVPQKEQDEDEEEARVGVCVPPKNALLLMRCRSDPVKMAALANKFWEPPPQNDADEEDKEDEEQQKSINVEEEEEEEETRIQEEGMECTSKDKWVSSDDFIQQTQETITDIVQHEWDSVKEQQETEIQEALSSPQENKDESTQENALQQCDQDSNLADPSVNLQLQLGLVHPVSQDYRATEHELEDQIQETKSESEEQVQEKLAIQEEESENNCSPGEDHQEEEEEEEEEEETLTHERPESEETLKAQQCQTGIQSKERETQNQPLLPDCLLLMMCEPKLSMEVSKETWVCSTDFIRWLPEPSRPVKKKNNGADHEPKKRSSIDIKFNPPSVHSKLQQPPRSSCSYPAKPPARAPGAESVSSAIEQKLVGTKACEPFMLKRCKSEPVRSTAKLAPENCFWKNRKLEPHCPATLGVGTAGVGC
ncbi:hypothetical protein M5689_013656 [Euphorbia peplus]|nr:hypothetical protein M5689_013656 [Euphorbia peplus]